MNNIEYGEISHAENIQIESIQVDYDKAVALVSTNFIQVDILFKAIITLVMPMIFTNKSSLTIKSIFHTNNH